MQPMTLSDERCIAAIYDGTLFEITSPNDRAHATCKRIHELVSTAAEELTGILAAENIESHRIGEPRLHHQFELKVEPDQVSRVTAILKKHDYQQWAPLQGGALRCYREHYRSMMFIRDTETTMRVQLRWGKRRRVPRIFRPNIKNLARIRLPEFAWPAYYLLCPLLNIANRLCGLHHAPEPRPFLGTPESLWHPLFELANLGPDDVFVDVGCGDGRVAIEATRRFGCRSIGIEYHSNIADRARARVRHSGLEEKISIVEGDATKVNLDAASVMFVFLPMSSFMILLPKILKQVNPGARIIAHELRPLDPDFKPQPKQSTPVFGEDAMTVAHVWIA